MSAEAKVIDLGAHDRMTPGQALGLASREEWNDVLIVGFHKDDGLLVMRSSHMTREAALWLVEHAKLHVMGQ